MAFLPNQIKSILKIEAKRSVIYSAATFIQQFAHLLVIPLLWQKLSPTDYGIIGVTEIIATFMAMYLGFALDMSVTRFYFEWPEEERKYRLGTLWLVNWITCILPGFLTIFGLSFISQYLFPDVSFYPFIYLGLIHAILKSMGALPFATIRILQKPWLYVFYSLSTFGSQLVLNILFVIVLDQQLEGYFVSNVISGVILALVGGTILLKFAVPCFRPPVLQEALKFSLPIIPNQMIGNVTSILDRYILQHYTSLEVLGIYSICLKFTNIVSQINSALKLSYVPFMVETVTKDRQQGTKTLAHVNLFYVLSLLTAGLAVSVYIQEFVALTGKAEYYPVVRWVSWLIFPAILASLNLYFAPGFFLGKRTDRMWIPSAINLVVILVTGLTLIPRFQLSGVVVSRYISSIIVFIISARLSFHYFRLPIQWYKTIFLLSSFIFVVILGSLISTESVPSTLILKTIVVITWVGVGFIVIIGFSTFKSIFHRFLPGHRKALD